MGDKIDKQSCFVSHCDSSRAELTCCFPRNEIQGSLWVKAINSPILNNLTYKEIIERRYCVCFRHFPENSFFLSKTGARRLKKDRIPSIDLVPALPITDVLQTKTVASPLTQTKKLIDVRNRHGCDATKIEFNINEFPVSSTLMFDYDMDVSPRKSAFGRGMPTCLQTVVNSCAVKKSVLQFVTPEIQPETSNPGGSFRSNQGKSQGFTLFPILIYSILNFYTNS